MPMCFDGDTPVMLKGDRDPKSLRELQPGDVLAEGGSVTATFTLLGRGQDMCRLGNIVLTGNHSVLHPELGWIAARDHPDSTALPDYSPEHVYCINTTSKRLYLDGFTFADWDDLDEADFETLQYSSAPLPARFGPQDIHAYLSAGHAPDAKVKLADGSTAAISCVQPGTRLHGGGECLGTVKLACPAHNEAFHLVVDRKMFRLNGEWVPHYDTSIEAYLEEGDQARRTPEAHKFLSSSSL